jgi:alanyl-tRNA synthetase
VRSTGQIGLFRIVSEAGVAAGVRRLEAVTGPLAYQRTLRERATLRDLAALLKTREENVLARVEALAEEHRELGRQLERARASGGSDLVSSLIEGATPVNGTRVIAARVDLSSADEARALGDRLRERMGSGVAVLGAEASGRASLYAVATDDLIARGVRADELIRDLAALAGGKGGGRPHMAQAGLSDPARLPELLQRVPEVVRGKLGGGER